MANRVITFHYTLTDSAGEELDSSRGEEPLSCLEGKGEIIPGLEEVLVTLKVGDSQKIDVPAAKAYGERDDQRVVEVPRDRFPKGDIKVGDLFRTNDESMPPLNVLAVTADHVTLDANHPLAGKDLTFDVEIVSIREATKEELSHGHSHGPEGHEHH